MTITRKSLLHRAALALGGITLGSLLGCGERKAIAAEKTVEAPPETGLVGCLYGVPIQESVNVPVGTVRFLSHPDSPYAAYEVANSAETRVFHSPMDLSDADLQAFRSDLISRTKRIAAMRAEVMAQRERSMRFCSGDSWNNHLDD